MCRLIVVLRFAVHRWLFVGCLHSSGASGGSPLLVSPVVADLSCAELDSEIVGCNEDSQQIQPTSKNQLSSTEKPVSEQPTGLFTQLEEVDIDFRVSGLPPAVVKQAENFSVRELVKKIESHPHREALQADLQQHSV